MKASRVRREVDEPQRAPDAVAQSAQLERPGLGHQREEQSARVGEQEDSERRAGPQRGEQVGGQRGDGRGGGEAGVESAADDAQAAHVLEVRAVHVQLAAREPVEEVEERRVRVARHDEAHELRAVHQLHALPEEARQRPRRAFARRVGRPLVTELPHVQAARVQRRRAPEHRMKPRGSHPDELLIF